MTTYIKEEAENPKESMPNLNLITHEKIINP